MLQSRLNIQIKDIIPLKSQALHLDVYQVQEADTPLLMVP